MLSLLSGCAGPQSILDPAGESARLVAGLWWGMFAWFSLVLLVVTALWIYAMRRKSESIAPDRARTLHIRWVVGGGIVLPVLSVLAILSAGIPTSKRLLHLAPDGSTPLVIEVVGHRWWWEIRYPEAGVTTANQVFLPAGRPVEFHISSADVIHSFWIPRLGGKLDAIPGRVNRLQLLANEPAVMRGQCAEFCGTGHAHMVFHVQSLDDEAFEQWLGQRQRPVAVDPGQQGAVAAFGRHCGQCHAVSGVTEGGSAPELSDIGARPLMGLPHPSDRAVGIADWLKNSKESLGRSLRTVDHRDMAPGELELIADWLETLGR